MALSSISDSQSPKPRVFESDSECDRRTRPHSDLALPYRKVQVCEVR